MSKQCPSCGSSHTVKNGTIHNKKQKYQCQTCKRQFVPNNSKVYINNQTKELIDKLLLEKISLAGIIRVTGVSKKWLQNYVNRNFAEVSQSIKCTQKKPEKLTIECDEMWSFVGSKNNKQWLWLAIDIETKEIVAFSLGERGEKGANQLWNSLPGIYRQCAICYTDFRSAYDMVFPDCRQLSVGKETGLTAHIERLNNTLRQRISRLRLKNFIFF